MSQSNDENRVGETVKLDDIYIEGDDAVTESVSAPTEKLDGYFEAESDSHNDKKEKKPSDETSPRYLSRLVITLTAICAAVAVLLAAVNAVTRDKISAGAEREKSEAVLEIFPDGTGSELYRTDGESETYLVFYGDGIIGYCAFVKSSGFGGDIEMMVGINADGATQGVKIVSMSETPGVGTKTKSDAFLSRFIGLTHSDPTGGVDAISGATISSNAVKAGVRAAHEIEIDLAAICAERNCELIMPSRLAEITESAESESQSTDVTVTASPTETEPAESEDISVSPDTEPEKSEPEEVTDEPFVDNPGGHNYLYNIDVSEGSDRFVIEIPKDDETATFTHKTEEPKTEPKKTEPAATEPKKTEAKKTEPAATTAPPATTPAPVTTVPEETLPPETTTDDNTIPSWLDTEPEETMPSWLDTEPEETMPSWLG